MTVIKGYYLYNGKTLKPWFSSLGDWLSTELYFLMMGPVGAHLWNTTQQNMVKGSAFLQVMRRVWRIIGFHFCSQISIWKGIHSNVLHNYYFEVLEENE